VREVKRLELPQKESTIRITAKTRVEEGGNVVIKPVEADGELLKFSVKLGQKNSTYRVWPHKARALFGAIPLGDSVEPGWFAYRVVYYGIGWVGAPLIMLLACVITAFYIPNMLRKGTIDLLLAKPINRLTLLLYKYVGGLTFMFLTTSFLITGLWVALGLRTGIWEPAFLLLVPILTFQFALFYALSTLVAVFTRSPIVCILFCVLLYGLLFAAGTFYWFTSLVKKAEANASEKDRLPRWVAPTADVTHGIVPHYYDLYWLTEKEIRKAHIRPSDAEIEKLDKEYEHYNWGESIAVTSAWIVLFLALACWRFAVKDY
jgi:ABC-type transport system involved in multi-copper enzyme maturation permease subunit